MKLKTLKHQQSFLTDKTKYSLLLGGIGSAKTTSGSFYVMNTIAEYPKALGSIFANSHKQLHTATLPNLFKWLDLTGIYYDWFDKQKGFLNVGNRTIITGSLENYDLLRGAELGWYWWDEAAFGEKEAFEVLNGRLRDKNGPMQGRLTTTPNGFNWLYDFFSGEEKSDESNYIKARSKDNFHLPDGYIESLMKQYDKRMIQQELEGEFVNVGSGQTYYSFDRLKNVSKVEQTNEPIYIGMDFNVNPMTAIFAYIRGDKIFVFAEAYLKDSNTYEMRDYIRNKFGTENISIIPDGTGKALKTSTAKISDHTLLKEYFGIKSVVSSTNPYQQDRFNCVNNLLEKERLIVDPSCKYLIKDLEQVSREKNDKMLTHISDALGYLCWNKFPLTIKVEARVRSY